MIEEFNKYWASVEGGHREQVRRDLDLHRDPCGCDACNAPIVAEVANRKTLALDVWGKAWEAGRDDMKGEILGGLLYRADKPGR